MNESYSEARAKSSARTPCTPPLGAFVRHRCPETSVGKVIGRQPSGSPVVLWLSGVLAPATLAAPVAALEILAVPASSLEVIQ